MSYKYYKVYGAWFANLYLQTPYNIWRGFKNRKLDVFNYVTNEFEDTGWKDIDRITGFSEWYLSYEKITKHEAYELMNTYKMIRELQK